MSGAISRNTYVVSQQLCVDVRDQECHFLLSWGPSRNEAIYKRGIESFFPTSSNPSQSYLLSKHQALHLELNLDESTENAAIFQPLKTFSHLHTVLSSTSTTTHLNKNESEDQLRKLYSFWSSKPPMRANWSACWVRQSPWWLFQYHICPNPGHQCHQSYQQLNSQSRWTSRSWFGSAFRSNSRGCIVWLWTSRTIWQ